MARSRARNGGMHGAPETRAVVPDSSPPRQSHTGPTAIEANLFPSDRSPFFGPSLPCPVRSISMSRDERFDPAECASVVRSAADVKKLRKAFWKRLDAPTMGWDRITKEIVVGISGKQLGRVLNPPSKSTKTVAQRQGARDGPRPQPRDLDLVRRVRRHGRRC